MHRRVSLVACFFLYMFIMKFVSANHHRVISPRFHVFFSCTCLISPILGIHPVHHRCLDLITSDWSTNLSASFSEKPSVTFIKITRRKTILRIRRKRKTEDAIFTACNLIGIRGCCFFAVSV